MHRSTPPDEGDCQVLLNSPSNRSGLPLSAVRAHPTRAIKTMADLFPNPGIVVLGRVEGRVEAFDRPGSTAVTFELADHSEGRR